mmetsp:Transcript_54876/g.130833  ORF Transcript_54876/g.130833 Transcript_54876/m.130833 type:complete len:381 (+) Transcript_54876:95-1237(+)
MMSRRSRHTNGSKDWEFAADLQLRSERRETLKMHRHRSWSGFMDKPAANGPILRGPVLEQNLMNGHVPHDGWCEKYACKAFAEYDTSRTGEVSMQNLHESLQGAELALDPGTFHQYMQKIGLPKGNAVAKTDFVNFHRTVWENQPPAVKRHVTLGGRGAMAASMPRCQTAPAAVSVKDIRESERVARRAFGRYVPQATGGGQMRAAVLPKLLCDLGFDAETTAEAVEATGDGRKKLAFEDFVGVMNQHMLAAEGWRDLAASPTDVPSRTRRLLDEARSFAASGQALWPEMPDKDGEGESERVQDELSAGPEGRSSVEQALKGRARSALAAAFAGAVSRPSSPLAQPPEAEPKEQVAGGGMELRTAVVSLALEGAARLSSK